MLTGLRSLADHGVLVEIGGGDVISVQYQLRIERLQTS